MDRAPAFVRELGNGLVLRAATAADAEPLAAFVGDMLRAQDSDTPDHRIAAWSRDLLEGRHPSFGAADATVVTDRTGAIVSCLHFVSQTWAYGGVPISVGQPELIGTSAEHRGRGLVRAQLEVIHRRSAARGHQLLVISGIPWFYRQFGYEMAIERGGGPSVHVQTLQPLPERPASWGVRAAVARDAAFLAEAGTAAAGRALVTVPRDTALWCYEITGKHQDSAARRAIRILERDGRPVGYVIHSGTLRADNLAVMAFEVAGGVSWREAWITALPDLIAAGEELAAATPGERFTTLSFWFLGHEHPLYRVFRFPEGDEGYAWYARVPDVAGFLRAVAPALERRLAASPCAGHSGTLTLSFYRDGVRMAFDHGRLAVERWRPDFTVQGLEFGQPSSDPRRPLAMFPDLTFLQLLFGFRSLAALEAAFPDCVVRTHEARALLDALFSRTPSHVWPVV